MSHSEHAHSHSHAHETEGVLSPYLARQRYKNAAKYVSTDDTVLDLGCGVGGFKKYLPSDTEYYGIDAEENWDKEKSGYLFKAKIGQSLPAKLQKKNFTVVSALALIEHLDDPGSLLRDAAKVLKKGGLLIVTTPHPLGRKVHDTGSRLGIFSSHASEEHEDFLDKVDLSKLAEGNGYKFVSYKRFLFGMNQIAVYRKK